MSRHTRDLHQEHCQQIPAWYPPYINSTWAAAHPTDPDLAPKAPPPPPVIIREHPNWLPEYMDETWCLAHPMQPPFAASPPPPPVSVVCDHPECLAQALGLATNTIFDNALTIVTAT